MANEACWLSLLDVALSSYPTNVSHKAPKRAAGLTSKRHHTAVYSINTCLDTSKTVTVSIVQLGPTAAGANQPASMLSQGSQTQMTTKD